MDILPILSMSLIPEKEAIPLFPLTLISEKETIPLFPFSVIPGKDEIHLFPLTLIPEKDAVPIFTFPLILENDATPLFPLYIVNIPCGKRTFKLIQDNYLPAGTKQRGVSFFKKIKDKGFEEVVTYGTVYGYGQVATAWCCKQVGLSCTIFLPKTFPRTKMTKEALKLGAVIVDVSPYNGYPTTSVISKKAYNYASEDKDRKMLGLGLDDPDYIQALSDGIKIAKGNINPKRIWVAGGSGVLARAIAKAFPDTKLCIVQVGRKIYPDVLEGINHNFYISPEPFRRNAEIVPPYVSLRHYDAKIWKFVRKYGQNGDYIWNVK